MSLQEQLKKIDDMNVGVAKKIRLKSIARFCAKNSSECDIENLSTLPRDELLKIKKLNMLSIASRSWDDNYRDGLVFGCKLGHRVTLVFYYHTEKNKQTRKDLGWFCEKCNVFIQNPSADVSKIVTKHFELKVRN